AGRKSRRTTAFMNFVANVLERLLAAADEEEPGPQLHEMESHRAAQAGAASGKKNGTTFQQIRLKHDRKTAFPGARSIVAAVGESGPGKRGTSGGCAIPPSAGVESRGPYGASPGQGRTGETLPTGHIRRVESEPGGELGSLQFAGPMVAGIGWPRALAYSVL